MVISSSRCAGKVTGTFPEQCTGSTSHTVAAARFSKFMAFSESLQNASGRWQLVLTVGSTLGVRSFLFGGAFGLCSVVNR